MNTHVFAVTPAPESEGHDPGSIAGIRGAEEARGLPSHFLQSEEECQANTVARMAEDSRRLHSGKCASRRRARPMADVKRSADAVQGPDALETQQRNVAAEHQQKHDAILRELERGAVSFMRVNRTAIQRDVSHLGGRRAVSTPAVRFRGPRGAVRPAARRTSRSTRAGPGELSDSDEPPGSGGYTVDEAREVARGIRALHPKATEWDLDRLLKGYVFALNPGQVACAKAMVAAELDDRSPAPPRPATLSDVGHQLTLDLAPGGAS